MSFVLLKNICHFKYRRVVLVRTPNLVVAKIEKHLRQVHSKKVADVQLLSLVAVKMVSDRNT